MSYTKGTPSWRTVPGHVNVGRRVRESRLTTSALRSDSTWL